MVVKERTHSMRHFLSASFVSLLFLSCMYACTPNNSDEQVQAQAQTQTQAQTQATSTSNAEQYDTSTEAGLRMTENTDTIKRNLPQIDFSKTFGASEHTRLWHVVEALEQLEIGKIVEVKSEPYNLEDTGEEVLKVTLINDSEKQFELVVDDEFYPHSIIRYDAPNVKLSYQITAPVESVE